MKPFAWMLSGCMALACGGSAFTAGEGAGSDGGTAGTESGGSDRGGGDRGGTSSSAGKSSVAGGGYGGKSSEGGRPGVSGAGGAASGSGGAVAGEPGVSGSAPVGGEPGVAGSGGSTSEPIDTECPETAENLGARCKVGLVCSFGEDIRTRCRAQATCPQGKWQVGAKLCEPLPACNMVIVGKECDGSVPECSLASGVYCACTLCPGAGPCGMQAVWACAGGSGGAACPVVPPNVGAKCTGSASCGYGSCGTDNSMVASCNGSSWRWEESACPN